MAIKVEFELHESTKISETRWAKNTYCKKIWTCPEILKYAKYHIFIKSYIEKYKTAWE